jgi:hypothetical protein
MTKIASPTNRKKHNLQKQSASFEILGFYLSQTNRGQKLWVKKSQNQ